MWAKRFPVPEFDRHSLKNLEWNPPQIATEQTIDENSCAAIHAPQEFYDHFSFRGDHLVTVACRLPRQEITISGNSFAWPIQRTIITDSLNAESCTILADWKTPRPMNTRFGPDEGIKIQAAKAYVLIGFQISDYWVGNRIMLDHDWTGQLGNGFRILSSSETEIHDFHDAVVYFEWK